MDRITALTWLNIGLLLILWIFSIIAFGDLPEKIPSHFDFEGKPDRWSEKNAIEFFLLPAVLTIINIVLLILLRFPHHYNFPHRYEVRKWPARFQKPVYNYIKLLVLVICLLINLMFIYIQYMIVDTSRSYPLNKSHTWLLILIAFIWLPIMIYAVIKINKIVKEQREKLDKFER